MKNCNSKIQKIFALLLSVMFIFVSCSDIFSGREETGSVTFSLSPELIQAVSNACRAADDDVASSDKPTATEQEGEKKDGKYKFEISIEGRAYKAHDLKSADDVTELKGKIFRFDNIPVGEKIYAEAKIIVAEEDSQWPIMKGKSEEKLIEAGENTLSFNLHKLAKCSVHNTTETGESLGEIERISVYAFPSSSEAAKELSELLVADTELNDLQIKSKLDKYKANIVGDYYKDGNSNLSQDFQDGYELKDGEYIFLSLVYIKKGSVYLGWATELTTEISLEKVNTINLALSEMNLKVENVELRFRFWDEEKKDYVALKDFPDKVLTNNDDYDEEFDELAETAVEFGYTINEDKSDELKYDEENDKYFITVYFDKLPKNLMFALPGIAVDLQNYPGWFTLNIYTDFSYEVAYVMPQADGAASGSAEPLIVSKGRYTFDFDEKAEDKNADDKISDANNMTIKELEYYDFESESLVKAEKPVEAKVDLTQSFTFKGGSGVEVKFTIPDIPDTKTTLKLSPEDLTVTVGEEKEFTVSLAYSDGTEKAATSITTDCNASETATVISEGGKIKVLGLAAGSVEVTVTSEGITQVFKFTVKAKEVTLTKIEFKEPPAEIGVGKEAAFEAYLVYSDGTEKPVSASTIKVSCSSEDVASVTVSSAKDGEIIVKGIKTGEATIKVWPTDNEKLAEALTINVVPTSTSSGIKVTLAEFDTTDLGANFTMSEETGADGSITLTATPEEVVSGYLYQWWIDGNPVDGATAMSYKWTAGMLENLGTGVHDVMLQITVTTDAGTETYSATTTFTLTSE